MDLGNHGEEMPMPIATQFGAIHEAAAKLKLLATTTTTPTTATTTSGNGTQQQQVDALDVKAGVPGPGLGPGGALVSASPAAVAASGSGAATTTTTPGTSQAKRVRFRECQKNHAASIGGHALDGCGEFMPCGEEGTLEALKCAACDCHRNFHRREVEGEPSCDCYRYKKRASSSLLLPGTGRGEGEEGGPSPYTPQHSTPGSSMKKRFRTKFTPEQKEKMLNFADKLGWRIQKHDEAEVQQFVNEVGVKRHVLKVWMHNNKHTLGKKG